MNDTVGVNPKEEIEGLGDPDLDVGHADYPLDDIMVRPETRTVAEVVTRIRRGRFILDPDFQRDFVWEPKKQSKLIESCVMRIPLPVLYVAEGADGRITVVDGLQRLGTFYRFLNDDLALTGLGHGHPLTDFRFTELPLNLQERVEDTQLTLYILDKNAPRRAQLDIFERVNGGTVLSRQQMRNAIYNGAGTSWLKKMSRATAFLEATGSSLNTKIMRDREAVNRFAGFYLLGPNSYDNGDMDSFLARAIEKLNRSGQDDLSRLRQKFLRSMECNFHLFGRHAFRKSLAKIEESRRLGRGGDERERLLAALKEASITRSPINIALFDVMSWMFARVPRAVVEKNKRVIVACIGELISDAEFKHAITYSTNSTVQVQKRFEMVDDALSGWVNA